ncbi:MAG: hypothetical protein B6D38_10070 [Anaerolineae bacterium UTCFX1]|jgi:hypothetical protein|nr:MAG: hypothetical protein B6D38_10070 [Anaerolineae bacterium UTCFX1]
MKILFKKTVLLAMIAALASLGAASQPLVSVLAAGLSDPSIPPHGELKDERLEKIWTHQLQLYEKLGKIENLIGKTQKLIDHVSEHGKDVSVVQSALDAFADAVDDAKPIYERGQAIIDSHAGFNADGKVTDSEQAKETVRAMGERMKEIKKAMGGTGKALRDAIHVFREANPRPEKTPTP